MEPQPRSFKLSTSALEWIVVGAVITTAIALAIFRVWLFRAGTSAPETSLPRLIVADRVILGFIRLLVAATALYGVASITVLVLRGRWARSISTSGIEADTSRLTDRAFEALESELKRTREERDGFMRLL